VEEMFWWREIREQGDGESSEHDRGGWPNLGVR